MLINVYVANSPYLQSHCFQFTGSDFVFYHLRLCIMSASVKLDNQARVGTIKICNIISKSFLTLKSYGIIF